MIMTKRKPRLAERLRTEIGLETRLLVPSIVLFELRYGAAKSQFPIRNLARIDDFLHSRRPPL